MWVLQHSGLPERLHGQLHISLVMSMGTGLGAEEHARQIRMDAQQLAVGVAPGARTAGMLDYRPGRYQGALRPRHAK